MQCQTRKSVSSATFQPQVPSELLVLSLALHQQLQKSYQIAVSTCWSLTSDWCGLVGGILTAQNRCIEDHQSQNCERHWTSTSLSCVLASSIEQPFEDEWTFCTLFNTCAQASYSLHMTHICGQDKKLHLLQPAWLIRCLIHRLDQLPASSSHQHLKMSHGREIWLPHELLHSGSPLKMYIVRLEPCWLGSALVLLATACLNANVRSAGM